ncbi:cell wall protein Ecm33 [Vermiconidia calcicola]|uniref:Cell wall protein Ecm33 n=1 Tax=Vermiconidia calcicola TaxID=1690605 RepID=A0ACC3NTQ9_9PEZI|nr:cell wall protein Ecm33 [Vermiconidia calcicola]
MALRYLVPALAVAVGQAAAQCSGTTTIQNAGDASALSTCSTYSGDIAIATDTTDDIAIDGVRRITGSLTAKNVPEMVSLSGDSLSQIDDSFVLDNVEILSTLNFPSLSAVETVDWIGLPNLQELSFTTGLSKVSSLSIQNTQLSNFDGINLEEVDVMNVANNFYLNDITMPLAYVGEALSLEANGRDVNANFPNLQWAYNMTFRNCSSVSIPSLSSLNGSMGFYSNYFDSLSAPNLTVSGGGIAFVSNERLTNISMPSLRQVGGGLQVANNTRLDSVDGFPRLQRVGGAIDFNGDFEDVQLPQLDDVRGAFNLQSEQNIDDACEEFRPLAGGRGSVIKGPFTCEGKLRNPGGVGSSGGSRTGSGGSSSSSGAANAVYISGATGVMGVVAAIFGML